MVSSRPGWATGPSGGASWAHETSGPAIEPVRYGCKVSLIILFVIAAITGSVGARIAGRRMDGCLTSIALGFVGALLGRWLAERLDLGTGPTFNDFPILWAVIGSALFVALVNLISGRGGPASNERR